MEQKHIPTDEQIARFLGGTATEEEKNAVLEYMSQSDENLEEVLAIADAVQAQRSSLTSQQSTSKSVAWRIAASVAVILLAGGAWLLLRDRGVNLEATSSNTVAMNTTPVGTSTPGSNATDGQTPSSDNTIVPTSNQATRQSNNTLIADADADPLSAKYKSLPSDVVRTPDAAGNPSLTVASSEVVGSQINPLKTQYDIVFREPVPETWKKGTPLTLSWNCSAQEIRLMVKPNDNSKVWIVNKKITSDSKEGKEGVFVLTKEMQDALTIENNKLLLRMEAYFNGVSKPTVVERQITVVN